MLCAGKGVPGGGERGAPRGCAIVIAAQKIAGLAPSGCRICPSGYLFLHVPNAACAQVTVAVVLAPGLVLAGHVWHTNVLCWCCGCPESALERGERSSPLGQGWWSGLCCALEGRTNSFQDMLYSKIFYVVMATKMLKINRGKKR